MRYLHTMLRVRDLDAALDFYCNKLGMKETRRRVDEKNRYTLVFLAGPADEKLVETSKNSGRPGPELELTYNWDTEDYGEARPEFLLVSTSFSSAGPARNTGYICSSHPPGGGSPSCQACCNKNRAPRLDREHAT